MDKLDQLRELWGMQDALNKRIGVNSDSMTDEEKTKWILNYCRAMTQEIAELTDSVPWKGWAKYQKFDHQNGRGGSRGFVSFSDQSSAPWLLRKSI